MKIWYFRLPAKGEIFADIEAETEEQARDILKTDDWEFKDEYCFDPEVEKATLIASK
jgi:hypothetical protein